MYMWVLTRDLLIWIAPSPAEIALHINVCHTYAENLLLATALVQLPDAPLWDSSRPLPCFPGQSCSCSHLGPHRGAIFPPPIHTHGGRAPEFLMSNSFFSLPPPRSSVSCASAFELAVLQRAKHTRSERREECFEFFLSRLTAKRVSLYFFISGSFHPPDVTFVPKHHIHFTQTCWPHTQVSFSWTFIGTNKHSLWSADIPSGVRKGWQGPCWLS